MLFQHNYKPIILNENEQIVLAVAARALPCLMDAIYIYFISGGLILPLLILHRLFKPTTYIITTKRLLIVEHDGLQDEVNINAVERTRRTRTSLMIYGQHKRTWLARLPDACFFENVLRKTITYTSRS